MTFCLNAKIIKPEEIFYNHGYEYYDSSLSIENIIAKLYGKKSNIITKLLMNVGGL